jgi:hypothetical protein
MDGDQVIYAEGSWRRLSPCFCRSLRQLRRSTPSPAFAMVLFRQTARFLSSGLLDRPQVSLVARRCASVSMSDQYAVLTVLVAFWTRVEFQAMRYMPWMVLGWGNASIRNSQHRRASQTIFLDYPIMWAPRAIYAAIKNRHYLVGAAIVTSLLIRVEIVLSTGLLQLQSITTEHEVPIQLKDSFNLTYGASPPFMRSQDLHPYVVMLGLAMLNMTYPEGNLPGISFQTFDSFMDSTRNITATRALVNTVSIDVQCETPKVSGFWEASRLAQQYIIDFNSSLCGGAVREGLFPYQANLKDIPYYWIYRDLNRDKSCPKNGSLALAAIVKTRNSNGTLEYLDSAAVICKVDGVSAKMESTRTKSGTSLSAVAPELAQRSIIANDMLNVMFYSKRHTKVDDRPLVAGSDYANNQEIFGSFRLATLLLPGGPPPISTLLNSTVLGQAMTLYFQTFGPIAISYKLKKASSINTTANVTFESSRLVVQEGNAQAMAGLFCVMILLVMPMLFQAAPKSGNLPRDPNSISGAAALLSNSGGFLSKLTGTGAKDIDLVTRRLPGSYYTTVLQRPGKVPPRVFQLKQLGAGPLPFEEESEEAGEESQGPEIGYIPFSLRTGCRIAGVAVIVILLTILWVLLGKSMTSSGLADVSNHPYAHFLWTALPTLVFVGLSLYLGVCDFDIRSLSPFAKLARRPMSFFESIAKTYTDEMGLRTLYKAVFDQNWGVLLSKTVALLAGLMPIFTSSLFSTENRERSYSVDIQQQTWLSSDGNLAEFWAEPGLVGNLILNQNLTYPPWTYEDLAFPNYAVADRSLSDRSNPIVSAKIQALTASLTCRTLVSAQGNLTDLACTHLIAENNPCFDENYFGFAAICKTISTNRTIPAFMNYVFGQCNGKGYKYATVLSCNETIMEVDVQTTLVGADLKISEEKRPVVDINSQRPTAMVLGAQAIYKLLLEDGPSNSLPGDLLSLDQLFHTMVSSRYAIQKESLGTAAGVPEVIKAIKLHHGILRAQILSVGNGTRLHFNQTSPFPPHTATQPPPSPATLSYTSNRLIQNAIPTFTLAALLALVLVLNAISLLATPKRGVVPKCPGSIAAMASLLADSTIFRHLPEGAEFMSDAELAGYFEGKSFRMGWFLDETGSVPERKFMIGVVEDEGAKVRYELEGDSVFRTKSGRNGHDTRTSEG